MVVKILRFVKELKERNVNVNGKEFKTITGGYIGVEVEIDKHKKLTVELINLDIKEFYKLTNRDLNKIYNYFKFMLGNDKVFVIKDLNNIKDIKSAIRHTLLTCNKTLTLNQFNNFIKGRLLCYA